MPTVTGFQILTIVVALLISSGAATFFIRYGTRLAIVEKTSTENAGEIKQQGKDLAATGQKVVMFEATLNEIQKSLTKLDQVPTIAATLAQMKQTLDSVVPRHEHEHHWKTTEKGLEMMREEIKEATHIAIEARTMAQVSEK